MQFEVIANVRNLQGSSASRRLRRAGTVPGIVYGGGAAPTVIETNHNDLLLKLKKEAFHSSIITLNIDGKKESVLLRDYQMHAYKPLVLHVDFQRVQATQALRQKVPLHFINAEIAPGVKVGGGAVLHALTEVEITCLPKDLPAFIEVDLKALNVGQSLHVAQLTFPQGVKPVLHGGEDPMVVSISVVKGTSEAAEGAEGEAEPAA